jgi:hypothetical protein
MSVAITVPNFPRRVGMRSLWGRYSRFRIVGLARRAPQPIFSFPCRVGNKAGGEDAYPTGSVFRLGARGQYCSAARLHLCFGSFAFGTVSLVSVVPCTHPGTFCPGPILFYSLHSCARGRYSSLPRFWAGRTILVSGPRSFYRSATGEDQRIAFPGIRGTTLERKYLTLFHLARQKSAQSSREEARSSCF